MLPHAGEAVGAIINGQWKLVRLVGEGGLAAVYEADSLQGKGKRALKILHPQFVSQRAIVERFYAEAKACFSLRHPHIAGVEAYAYAEDGSPYIVMELLQGMSLEEFLRNREPMQPSMAAPIMYGILQALSVAHARGIVHRDLKPANLFLTPQPSGEYTVKVLDFGIAKVMDIAGGMGSKTRTGAVLGTPGYMSPEQVKNAKAVDARTDLWAAGVVLFEMLACEHPYGASDQLARMVAVLRDEPSKMSAKRPDLAQWDPFFDRALARDPNQRFQSAQEMAEALRTLAQGTPARFVPEGLQTVALPMMPDMMAKSPTTAASPAVSQTPQSAAQQAYASQHQSQVNPTPAPNTPQSPGGYGYPPQPAAQNGYPGVQSYPPPMQAGADAHLASVPPAPPTGVSAPYQDAVRRAGATQISADRPDGTPAYHSDVPPVRVMEARDEEPPALVWWGVIAVALATFAFGLLVGYLLASS